MARAVFVPRAPTLSGVPTRSRRESSPCRVTLWSSGSPTDPDRVLKKAGDESRRTGRHGASVFAAVGDRGSLT